MFRALVAAAAAIVSIASIPSAFAAPSAANQLQKRTTGRATYYAVGLGACGQWNVPSDFIVAINEHQYDGGARCGQGITISANGKTVHATVMDLCPFAYCNYGDLDLSEGLFTQFAGTGDGVFQMEWWFDGQGPSTGGGYTPPPPPPPQPEPPTPTPTPETPTSTWTPPPTTTESSSSSSESFSAAAAPSSSESPAPQWDPSAGAVPAMNKAAINLANLIYAAHNA